MNDILKTTMAVIAAIAVMAAVFVPMTMEFGEQAHYTMNRNEGGYYTLVEDDKKVVVEVDNVSATATINGRTYDVNKYGTYLMSDFAMMNFIPQNPSYHSVFTTELTCRIGIGETAISKMVMTFEDGTATMELTTSTGIKTYTGSYSYILHYSGGAGNYIQTSNITTMKVNADSKVYFIKNSGINGNSIIAGPFKASDRSGTGTEYTNGTGNVPTGADTTVTWTLTDNGDKTYTISNPIYGSESTSLPNALIPIKYQVYNEDSMIAFMVNILPVLVGLAFLAGIGMYITRFKN